MVSKQVLLPVAGMLLQEMAVKIVQVILKNVTWVESVEKVEMLLDFIAPLITDAEGVADYTEDEVWT